MRRNSVLGLQSVGALAALIALSASPDHTDLDGGPVFVASGAGSPVIHRRGRFKPNQRKQRRGERA